LLVGIGVMAWMPPSPPLPVTHTDTGLQYRTQLVNIEKAITALTQELHAKPTPEARPEPTRVAVQVNDDASRQALGRLIRDEIRQAMAEASPEAQRAREEVIAEAQILNSPANHAAYQSASSIVHTAVAAQRWTENDKENFRVAFGALTNNQRMELMNT